MTNPPLKYLFIARFADGSEVVQTPEDKSDLEPGKSQYFDVLQKAGLKTEMRDSGRKREDDRSPIMEEVEVAYTNPIVRFEVYGDGHEYVVDLKDGHFEVDGVPFRMMAEQLPQYRLVFYRRHRHDFIAGSGEETSHTVTYCFGWQWNMNGRNYQRVMELD